MEREFKHLFTKETNVKNLPTKKEKKKSFPRLFRQTKKSRRKKDYCEENEKGQKKAFCIMLSSKNKLTRKEILGLLPKAKSLTGGFLLLRSQQNKEQQLKVGVSISKKILKSAVKRNFFRRIVYRLVSQNINQIKPMLLFFVINKTGTRKEIEKDVFYLIKKAGAFKED